MTTGDEFAALVREYMVLVADAGQHRAWDLLVSCARLLPRLYAAGLDLPEVAPGDTDLPGAVTFPPVALGTLLGRADRYVDVVDPADGQELVMPSFISADLSEIYLDLAGPLHLFDRGQPAAAIWSWRFTMRGHCGDHLVSALRAIHKQAHYHLDPDYRADGA